MRWIPPDAPHARLDPVVPIVTLGGWDNVLTFARSLGRRGVPLYALGAGWNLRLSRFVRWIPPSECGTSSEGWLSWLLSEQARALHGALVLPCNDDAAELVAREQRALAPLYRLPPSPPELVLEMLDKSRTYALAREIGVATPRTWDVPDRAALERAIAEAEFPCALKPRDSHLFRRSFPGRKVFVAASGAELERSFDETAAHGLRMLVTEIVPGGDDRYASFGTWTDERGGEVFGYTKTKPRQYPIHFGLGTLHVSRWLPEIAALGRRFLSGIGMRGPASVEFKRDPRDERWKLIECNPRVVAATYEVAERSGLDLAWAVYARTTGAPTAALGGYRDDVRVWSPLHDGKAFLEYRRAGELSTAAWLASIARPACHVAQFRWSDPMPALGYAWQAIRRRAPADGAPSAGERLLPRVSR